MKSVWREYGVIATLLVVAIGGYLYMSRNQVQLIDLTLDSIGNHLLSLVQDGGERGRVAATLDTLRMRVDEGEVAPERLERYAASVFNIGTTGEMLAPEEAEMVVRMAYSDQSALPTPEKGATRTKPVPGKRTAPSDIRKTAEVLQPMVAFFETIREDAASDSVGPAFRFYSDGRLHVVVDDRLREKVARETEAQVLMQDRAVTWRAHLAEAADAERRHYRERATELGRIAEVWSDSLRVKPTAEVLARLNRLRSLGMVPEEQVDSIATLIEAELEIILSRMLPPPPPGTEGNRDASTTSSSDPSTGR